MKVLKLENIAREEGHIFYRRKYEADATIELPTADEKARVNFVIDVSPLGVKTVELESINPTPNYPLSSIKKALKDFILTEEIEGRLPC